MISKTQPELFKNLVDKVNALKLVVELTKKQPLESDIRLEMSRNIADTLRSILYGDKSNNNMSLVERCGLNNKLIFPVYNFAFSVNLLPTYNLLEFRINNNEIYTIESESILKRGIFWKYYLDFDSWLNEIIIDTKQEDIEPISRIVLIKIIADTQGSHVDNGIDERIFNMQHNYLLPVVVVDGNNERQDLEVKANSICCESIISIADELIYAFEEFSSAKIEIYGKDKMDGIIHVFKNTKNAYISVKYDASYDKKRSYNSNSFFECEIFRGKLHTYNIKSRNMHFLSCIIHKKDLLNSTFIRKMKYGDE